MKVGDEVVIEGKPEFGEGRVVRFYANQGTVLVDFKKSKKLTYCDYQSLVASRSSSEEQSKSPS